METIKNLNISLIIATYNDEKHLIKQLNYCEEILNKYCKSYEIIVSDDLSSDKTRILLNKNYSNKKNYRIIFNKTNLGITSNMRQLYSLATKEYILLYSVDGDWNPRNVETLIKTKIKNKSDIVIGRRIKKNGYTPYRKLISYLHRYIPIILFGIDPIDPGGIKIVKRELAQINLISRSQFFEAEIIIKSKLSGKNISSCNVSYNKDNYGSGSGGKILPAISSFLDALRLKLHLLS